MSIDKPNMEFHDFAPAPAGFKWERDKVNGKWKLIQTIEDKIKPKSNGGK